MFLDMLKGVFLGGMPPAEVAQQVFDAIVARRFYVLTHPEHNPQLQRRAEAILAGDPPPTLTPSP